MNRESIKVLLIEDNPGDRRIVQEVLSNVGSVVFELNYAEWLSTGLEQLADGDIDVVLLDLDLPDSQGLATLDQVRVQAPKVPIVIMTGLSDEDTAIKALQRDAQDYQVKGQMDSNMLSRVIRYAIERKRTEEALRQEQVETLRLKIFLENIMNNIITGLLVTDNNGKVVTINRSGQEILGITEDEVVGKPIEELSSNLGVVKQTTLPTAAQPQISVRRSDGREIPLRFASTELRDTDGRKTGVVTVFEDLTEIKELERKLQDKEKLATIAEIARGFAHEIKNPLFAILTGIQLLEPEFRLDNKQNRIYQVLLREIFRVDQLIKQLLDFSVRADLKRTNQRLEILIDTATNLNQDLLQSKGIKVRRNLPADIPLLSIDENKMVQVLSNLLQNAADVSKEDDAIDITYRVDPSKHYVTIQVQDQGSGIPEEFRNRIFEPFFSNKPGSRGMGLTISKKIVLDHGGSIWYEPRENGGSTFVIELPFE